MKKLFITLLLTIKAAIVFSQHVAAREKIFTIDDFIQQLKQYHPIIKQADILISKAEADIQSARGAFDPVLAIDASRKTFDGKNYYYYSNPEIQLPLLFGANIKTGVENNGGAFLSSEASQGQTSYLGVEVPLARGLLTDKRRTALKQAKIFLRQSEQERLSILNDLLFNAYNSYWQWAATYQLYKTYDRYVTIASNRLQLVRIAYMNGDKPMMDTIEAFIQLQNYQLQQTNALLEFNNAAIELSAFLWQENDKAMELPNYYKPDTIAFLKQQQIERVDTIIEKSQTLHPAIKNYILKLDALEVERKLKFQNLLPYLSIKANLLNKGYYVFKNIDGALLQNNYKWGIDFKVPLLLREGRGEYRKSKLKIKETQFELLNKQRQIETKIRSYYNEYTLLQQQLNITSEMYERYLKLLQNEEIRFFQGESSLFLVNSRETKVLESLQKQTEVKLKYLKAFYAVQMAAGLLR